MSLSMPDVRHLRSSCRLRRFCDRISSSPRHPTETLTTATIVYPHKLQQHKHVYNSDSSFSFARLVASRVAARNEPPSGRTCEERPLLYFPKNVSAERLIRISIVCPAVCVRSLTCCVRSAAFRMASKCLVSVF